MMRAAIYARVSKEREGEQHPETQVEVLRAMLQDRGMAEAGVYVDRASGARDDRPALQQLLRDVQTGDIDAVVFTKLDRLARSVTHLSRIAEALREAGVDMICKDQPIDTSTASGKLMFHVLSAVAEFERDLIRERTKEGIGARDGYSRRGKRLGRRCRKIDVNAAREALLRTGNLTGVAARMGCARSTLRAHLYGK